MSDEIVTFEQLKESIDKILGECNNIKQVIVVGSYARNEINSGSDVDIVIELIDKNDVNDYWYFLEALERQLQRDVDLMLIEGVKRSMMRDKILKDTIVVYKK